MKKLSVKKCVLAAVFMAMGGVVFAQADSSSVPPLRGTPRLLPLSMQERETPVVNNVTNTSVTQVVQPNTSNVTSGWIGGYAGTWLATATISCGSKKLLSGGGQCNDFLGSFGRAKNSYPSGNSWIYVCGADENGSNGTIFASASAVCSD